MIEIKYRKFSDTDLAKARRILGIDKDFKIEDRIEAGRKVAEWSEEGKYDELSRVLNIDALQTRQLMVSLARGQPAMGSASDKEIYLTALGDKVDERLGDVAAHEMGHIQTHLERPDIMTQEHNDIMRELIAVYYAFLTAGNKGMFDRSMVTLKEVYDITAEEKPEYLQGMTFAEMKATAMKIAKKDLGAATPEQRAMKRQGRRRRNGGSHNTIQGVR